MCYAGMTGIAHNHLEREEGMDYLNKSQKRKRRFAKFKRNIPYHLMLLPSVIIVFIFGYIPMGGVVIAFQDYKMAKGISGSEWVGLKNFQFLFNYSGFWNIFKNTVVIAVSKMVLGTIVPIVFALLLNEIKSKKFMRITQTLVYLPHFLSWVILSGVFNSVLSPTGIVNNILGALGLGNYYFLGDNKLFQGTMIWTHVWKTFGYGSIIYLAALTGVSPELHEAAAIDGANWFKRIIHINIPTIFPIIFVSVILSMPGILNAGSDQILNMYSAAVYESGDVLDTFVYRLGIEEAKYSLSTAVDLFKSCISVPLMSISYYLAVKYGNYELF